MMVHGLIAEHYLLLAAVLFTIAAIGFLVRRNLLVQLMSLELMLNAANLVFVAANRLHVANMNGQGFALFVIAVEAAELAVGLAIVLALYRLRNSVHSDDADTLRH
jgi:NADH-quinone oxidoreductase subunit K